MMGCTVSRGSAFKQLTSVNKSDWHMSEAAPCSVAAVIKGLKSLAERGCAEADVCICICLCSFACVYVQFENRHTYEMVEI